MIKIKIIWMIGTRRIDIKLDDPSLKDRHHSFVPHHRLSGQATTHSRKANIPRGGQLNRHHGSHHHHGAHRGCHAATSGVRAGRIRHLHGELPAPNGAATGPAGAAGRRPIGPRALGDRRDGVQRVARPDQGAGVGGDDLRQGARPLRLLDPAAVPHHGGRQVRNCQVHGLGEL